MKLSYHVSVPGDDKSLLQCIVNNEIHRMEAEKKGSVKLYLVDALFTGTAWTLLFQTQPYEKVQT